MEKVETLKVVQIKTLYIIFWRFADRAPQYIYLSN